MNIRLLVLDIDGTMVGPSNEIRPRVLEALAAVQSQGIPVALATGRMYRSAVRFHHQIQSSMPVISYQGALIKDPLTGKVYRHLSVPPPLALGFLDYLEEPSLRSEVSIHFYLQDELYVREMSNQTASYCQRSAVEPNIVGDLRRIVDQEPTKVIALAEDTSLIKRLLVKLRAVYQPQELYLTTSVPNFLEATNPRANKGQGVAYLSEEILGLKPGQVMAIGDNMNDLEMLRYTGVSIAMGGSPPDLQSVATWVAPGVEEDGVAVAIEKFIL